MSERAQSGAVVFPKLPQLPLDAFKEGAQRGLVKQFNEKLAQWYEQVNGRISLGDQLGSWSGHIDGERLVVLTAAVNVDFPVAHNLGRIPCGYIVTRAGDADFGLAQLDTTPAATANLIWFQSGAAVGTRYEILVF